MGRGCVLLSAFVNRLYVLNDTIEINAEPYEFFVSGYCDGRYYNRIEWSHPYSDWWYLYAYNDNSSTATLASYRVTTGNLSISTHYILFTGGTDLNSPEFVVWVSQNAHPTEDDYIYKVTKSSLVATADAIRTKLGTSDAIRWDVYSNDGFSRAIQNIYLGNDTRNTTAYPSDIALDRTAFSRNREMNGIIPLARGADF